MINIEKLRGKVPQNVFEELPEVIKKYSLSALQLAHFLAQTDHESGGFKHTVESLMYSADGLMAVFPKYFTHNKAREYARQPEKIASRVYANRMGNGDEASKEGWKYRGRGYIQLTGRINHQRFFESVGLPIDSEPLLISNVYPLQSAAWFFADDHIFSACGVGDSDSAVKVVTRMVNGGTNGLNERIGLFHKYCGLLA